MILVTGASGLVGSRLLYDLTRAGHPVRALRRNQRTAVCIDRYFRDQEQLLNRVEWCEADLMDYPAMKDLLRGITRVYHCAGMVSFQPGARESLYRVNAEGTATLVNLCLDAGVQKFCHVSSVAALGRASGSGDIHEGEVWKTSPYNSNYAVSKYGAEREVWRGVAEGLNAVIVNPGIILGPGNWKTDSSAIFAQVWNGLRFYTTGGSGFVDVEDVSGIMQALMDREISAERFILVAENLSFRELTASIAQAFHKPAPSIKAGSFLSTVAWTSQWALGKITSHPPLITRETARSAQSTYRYANRKIVETLNWKFKALEQTVRETCAVFSRENAAHVHH